MKRVVTIISDDRIAVNLNRIYGDHPPSPDRIEHYTAVLESELPESNKLKEMTVVLDGTGPIWFFVDVCILLKPLVKEIYLKDRQGPVRITSSMLKAKSES